MDRPLHRRDLLLGAVGAGAAVWLGCGAREAGEPGEDVTAVEPGRDRDVERVWGRIEDWMEQNAPPALDVLRPGASEGRIRAAQDSLDLKLPEAFVRSLARHDGQEWEAPSLVGFGMLMNLEEIVVRARENERVGVDEAPTVAERWWRRGWVPFVARDGDYLSLALGPGGRGEVWCFLHDQDPGHSRVAPDFTTWLQRWADELHAGVFALEFSPGGGILVREGRSTRLWPRGDAGSVGVP